MIKKKEMKFSNKLKKKLIMLMNMPQQPQLKELECLQKLKQMKEMKDSLLILGKDKYLSLQASNTMLLCLLHQMKISELKELLATERLIVVKI